MASGENSLSSGVDSVEKARQSESDMESEVSLMLAGPCWKQGQGVPSFSSLRSSLLPTNFIFPFWLGQALRGTLCG